MPASLKLPGQTVLLQTCKFLHSKNKFAKSAKFSLAEKLHFRNHLYQPFHHTLSTKKPPAAPHFCEKTL
jgi:N-formylglutamate amidohydrolase